MLVPLVTSGSSVSSSNFWNAIFLYHDRPHVVNRKLSGAIQVYFYEINYNNSGVKLVELLNYTSVIYETNKLTELNRETLNDLIKSLLEPYDKNVGINEVPIETRERFQGIYISVKVLLSSNPKCSHCVELALIDKINNKVTFVAGTTNNKYTSIAPPFPYTFEHDNSGHVRLMLSTDDADSSSAEWLDEKLFQKVMKWAEEYDPTIVTTQSLSLISIEKYFTLYASLKDKYGAKMVQIWPENTDPLKFVYEDIAIATYLICLWEKIDEGRKPSFVDLGCGNGLLVYILNEEGYSGCGIDVRKRKIWDLYPASVKLEIRTIIPSDKSLFPTTDWIIGNHSDELTPWIPVIASRSSPKTNFFVLPCCCYDFNGRKYSRKNPNKSQYNEYIEYINLISQKCGFITEIDKLRIPSTKRTCLVSLNRSHTPEEFVKIDEDIKSMINKICGDNESNIWVKDFQARENVEKVRNCTQLSKELIGRIVKRVVDELLKNQVTIYKKDGSEWNSGGSVTLPELIKIINKGDLKNLKNECGGLQTLLKNHRYIFDVSKGCVKLRLPLLFSDVQKYKSKPCWFLNNHPDSCLHTEDCAYMH